MYKEEYKLKRTDINYLGIELNEYPIEEVRYFFGEKDEILINQFVRDLLYVNNRSKGFEVGCASADFLPVKCPFEMVMDIVSALKELYHELERIWEFPEFNDDIDDQYKEPFKLILERMVELREKGINTLGTEHIFYPSLEAEKAYSFLEVEEISDDRLFFHIDCEKDERNILKQRNIERLKRLFEEEKKV